MREEEFREFCLKRGLSQEQAESAVAAVGELEDRLTEVGRDLDSASVEDYREHVSLLMSQGRNSMDRLLALARYSYLVKNNEAYVYFASILGGRSVLPSISERLASIAGEEARDRVFEGVEAPPLGSPPEEFPPVTRRLMSRLEAQLSQETCRRVLAWNHHRVPRERFAEDRERLLQAGSVDEFLVGLHGRAVVELERYMAEGRIWYEQVITPRVVEYVRGNQEVLAGVRRGDRIYMTKFPYAPEEYLTETDPLMRRYYACHCPLARASILEGGSDFPSEWCYCSGGFEKLLFDVVFGEEVEVEVLESALAGDPRCRFAVRIPEGKLK
jgi:hypothetical protein